MKMVVANTYLPSNENGGCESMKVLLIFACYEQFDWPKKGQSYLLYYSGTCAIRHPGTSDKNL